MVGGARPQLPEEELVARIQALIAELPTYGYPERAAYIAAGSVEVGGERLEAGAMAVLAPGADVPLVAQSEATVMVLGGEPVGERFMFWNFVHSRKDRIAQAAQDWREGRFALPPQDNLEFTPLPEFKGF